MRVVLKKSVARAICKRWCFPQVLKAVEAAAFERYKAAVGRLARRMIAREEARLQKSLQFAWLEKGKAANPGTVHYWGAQQIPYVKLQNGKWRRKYESHDQGSRGFVRAMRNFDRERGKCKSFDELDALIHNYLYRFKDDKGMPLPQAQEFYSETNKLRRKYKRQETEEQEAKRCEEMASLAGVLKSGKSMTVQREGFGEITVDAGKEGKHGFGLKHIISERLVKDGKSVDEIAALISLVLDAARYGKKIEYSEDKERAKITHNGVVCIVSKQRSGKSENWILTGFGDWGDEKTAAGSIQSVNDQYRYTPEYSFFRKQVGAAVAQLGSIDNRQDVSSEKIAKAKKTIADEKQRQAKEDVVIKKLKEKFKEWSDGFVEEYFINGYVCAGKHSSLSEYSSDAKNLYDIEGNPLFDDYIRQVGRPTAKGSRWVYSEKTVNLLKPDGTLLRDDWIEAGGAKVITNNINAIQQEDGTYQLCNDDWEPISPEKYGRVSYVRLWTKIPFYTLFEYKNDDRHHNLGGVYSSQIGDKYKLIDKDGNILPYTFISKLTDNGPYEGTWKTRVNHGQLQVFRDDGKQNLIGPEGLLLKEFYDYVDNCPITFSTDASTSNEFYDNAYTVVGRKNSKGEYEYNLAWLKTGKVIGDWLTADKYSNDTSKDDNAWRSRAKYTLEGRAKEVMKQRYEAQKSFPPRRCRLMLRKSVADEICRCWGFPIVLKSVRDPKLEYFKRKILAHLDKLERKEKQEMRKSLAYLERLEKAQKRNVGDIVTWGRKVKHEYIKGADGKWRRYYRGTSRGQKLSVAALRRKVDACKDTAELWDLVANNWGRFMDADGMPLPVVRELHAYASKREDEITAGVIDKPRPERRGKKKLTPEEEEENAKLNAMSDEELESLIKETDRQKQYALEHDKELAVLNAKRESLKKVFDRKSATGGKEWNEYILVNKIVLDGIQIRNNEVSAPFDNKIAKAQGVLNKRATVRLRTKRQEMIRERRSKEQSKDIKGLYDFAFIKNGELNEKELANFAEDYKKLTPEYRAILEKYAKDMKVDMHYQKRAWYDKATNSIHLNIQPDERSDVLGFKTSMVVFLHEAGHWLDYNVLSARGETIRSRLPLLRSFLKNDFLTFINKMPCTDRKETAVTRLKRGILDKFVTFVSTDTFSKTSEELKRKEAEHIKNGISDIAAGLTRKPEFFPYKHGYKYWTGDNLESETIAHFFETYGTDDEKEAMMKEVFPVAYEYIEDLVKRL